ncbi:MAG: lipase family protein, partial [Raoultibacter sp.]
VVAGSDPANPSGRTATKLTFNDSWFSADSHNYNHELATACSILSAVSNSESQFYGNVTGSIPYAEQTLSSLGFGAIRTESYALRSDLFDQMAAFFVDSHDVAAYAFASKTIVGKDGAPNETLVFVGIRGSYGIEWFSNFNLFGSNQEDPDHLGFKLAEREVAGALESYLRDIDADPARTKVLITGHSRGGSIANLLAADINTKAGTADAFVPSQNVYAYTFASPCSTQSPDQANGLHKNIFNIINPADVVPQLPLSTWGFGRYGSKVELPDATKPDVASLYDSMQVEFQNNTGYASPYEADELEALDSFDVTASKALPVYESLLSPQGIVSAVQTVSGIDIDMMCITHYPDTYIAWMQSVDSDALKIE